MYDLRTVPRVHVRKVNPLLAGGAPLIKRVLLTVSYGPQAVQLRGERARRQHGVL